MKYKIFDQVDNPDGFIDVDETYPTHRLEFEDYPEGFLDPDFLTSTYPFTQGKTQRLVAYGFKESIKDFLWNLVEKEKIFSLKKVNSTPNIFDLTIIDSSPNEAIKGLAFEAGCRFNHVSDEIKVRGIPICLKNFLWEFGVHNAKT